MMTKEILERCRYIVEEVPPIRYLDGLWRADSDGFGIATTAVARNDLNGGVRR